MKIRSASPSRSGFSLIELLTVMAIISIMTAAVIPAINAITGAGDLGKAATDIGSVLEQARSYAMANNTYVFIGVSEVDGAAEPGASSASGTGRVIVVAAGSKDGTSDVSAANLVALSKLRYFNNVHLDAAVTTAGNMARPAATDNLGSNSFVAEGSLNWPLSGTPRYTFTKIIQFDPRGTASIQSSASDYSRSMEIGLAQARGNVAINSANAAALILDGVTGSVKIYRP